MHRIASLNRDFINRFPKSHRLHDAEEFSAVIRFRCSVSSEFLQAFAKPNDRAHPRLGLIVARKIERLAVNRNRIKRELREAFRAQQGQMAGLDLVLRLRRPLRQAGSGLAEEVGKLMMQLQRCRG